jgi:hypothetical protein
MRGAAYTNRKTPGNIALVFANNVSAVVLNFVSARFRTSEANPL